MTEAKDMTFTLETAHAKVSEMIGAIPTALTEYSCPLCGKIFGCYADLKQHYAVEHVGAIPPVTVVLTLNGKSCEVLIEPHWTLKRTLQFRLGLTGAKHMCDKGVCGSCTVIMDGRAVLSCQMLAIECEGKDIQTVEGIAADPKWKPPGRCLLPLGRYAVRLLHPRFPGIRQEPA